MRIAETTCVKDVKCNECGKLLKADIDSRYGIIPRHSGSGVLLCQYCFADLKETMNQMWIHLK